MRWLMISSILGYASASYAMNINDLNVNFLQISPTKNIEKWNNVQKRALGKINRDHAESKILKNQKPFVVMVSGAEKTGKSTLLEGVYLYFKNLLAQNNSKSNLIIYKSSPGQKKYFPDTFLKESFIFLDDDYIDFNKFNKFSQNSFIMMANRQNFEKMLLNAPKIKEINTSINKCYLDLNDLIESEPDKDENNILSTEQEKNESAKKYVQLTDHLKYYIALLNYIDAKNKIENQNIPVIEKKNNEDEEESSEVKRVESDKEKRKSDNGSSFQNLSSQGIFLKNIKFFDIYTHVTQSIKRQDEPVKKISNILMSHKSFINKKYFQNARVLLHGPSGCGKTAIVSRIAEKMNMPFFSINASSLTGSGFKGQNLNDQLENIIDKCQTEKIDHNQVIIFFDEIDKLFTQYLSEGTTPGNVLNELLVFMEKGITLRRKEGFKETICDMSTKNSAIFFAGAFNQVDIEKAQRVFPEFFGRIHDIIKINKLKQDDFVEITLTSQESPYVVMRKILEEDGRNLVVDQDALAYIGKYAVKRGTGARAVQYVFNELLVPYFGERETEKEVHITKKNCEDLFDSFMNNDDDQPPRGMYI
jgi:ATP-dependent Clp protease ATP-binding subunit ClpX